ncbi:DUF58 domain-containing protein [Gaiella sp.]|jgi:uncharacterized protein (DUF58 family)|uniref:DUF58 domain-containing protein n=1 Tax=Gaiella sp. TaxID=2663207 RepID=UPI002E2ED571|nr:DUF58 domain-containing protein [Gaiella sp.]HEX5584077.1 DUF58 domain-containing protein [Gaiella sp.]
MSTSVADALGRVRTPAEPGPGPLSISSLQALDLAIGDRLGGLLAGDYRSVFGGPGTELYQLQPYAPGDDVRQIDWNVLARSGEAYVRVKLAERMLVTWIVADMSASMAFGTGDRRKTDVAEGVSIAIGHLATQRGNRLGVVAFGAGGQRFQRPGQGRRGLLLALAAMRDAPAGRGSLQDALALVEGLALRRSLVVVVSDFRGPLEECRDGLLRVAARHRTLAVEIRDPREQRLADVGEVRLEDPETGRQMLVDTRDARLRDLFARAAEDERRTVETMLSTTGTRHVVLSTDRDWLEPLTSFLRRGDRR